MTPIKAIYGIVVCGGKSSRMGSDKSSLVYHKVPQWQYVYQLLEALNLEVYISVNEKQAVRLPQDLPLLPDLSGYRNVGPSAALLTAYEQFPGKDLLVIGCDYPFLKSVILEHFLQFVREGDTAAAFYNEKENLYEPLLAFYPATAAMALQDQFSRGNYSLQSLLRQQHARKFFPVDGNSIQSVDTPAQYHTALKYLDTEHGFKKED
jgi:molybdopterin-guanine dinucleotide biosynthesis protein A